MGKVKVPSPMELEAHPVPPSRGQNQQWWPEQTPPTGTPRNNRTAYTPTGSNWDKPPTPTPIKLYENFLEEKLGEIWSVFAIYGSTVHVAW